VKKRSVPAEKLLELWLEGIADPTGNRHFIGSCDKSGLHLHPVF